jgi:hypothetical protein
MTVNQIKNKKLSDLFRITTLLVEICGVVAILLIIIPPLPGLMSNLTYSFDGKAPRYLYLSARLVS